MLNDGAGYSDHSESDGYMNLDSYIKGACDVDRSGRVEYASGYAMDLACSGPTCGNPDNLGANAITCPGGGTPKAAGTPCTGTSGTCVNDDAACCTPGAPSHR